MKQIYFVAVILFSSFVSAQVGIDTENPQQQLHISGTATAADSLGVVGPTIRIEGLNQTNNPAFENGSTIQPVYANQNGDLVLRNDSVDSGFGYKVGNNLPGDDITTPLIVFYRNEARPVVRNIGVYDFSLPATSLVHFNKTITFNFAESATAPLNDGRPRFADSEWVISQAPTNTLLGKIIGRDGVTYTSSGPGEGISQSGHVWATGSESIILPAGNYRVRLNTRVYGNAGLGNYDFVVQVGGGDIDEISIIAQPFPY